MKKFINAALLLFIFVWFNGQKASGQYINVALPGNISQYSCGVQDYQIYESETAVDFLKVGCFEYKIVVSNSKFSLYADDCSTLWNFQFAEDFNNPITNPDVVLLRNKDYTPNDVYAVIVYFDPAQMAYIAETMNATDPLNISRHSFILQDGFSSIPEPNDNAIRIDANSNGDFVIVWEDFENNKIYMLSGYVYGNLTSLPPPAITTYYDMGTTPPTYIIAPVEIDANGLTKPDVAISESLSEKIADVYVTFLNTAQDEIYVHQTTFTNLEYSNLVYPDPYTPMSEIPNLIFSERHSGTIGRPRIAAPGLINDEIYPEDWTVVYAVEENGISHIHGNTKHNGVNKAHIYTNNTEIKLIEAGGTVTYNDWHKNPAISYGNGSYTSVIAQVVWQGGWEEPMSTLEGTDVPTILALSINQIGCVASCSPNLAFYKVVPDQNHEFSMNPSVAGRLADNSNIIIAWWDDADQEIYVKDFDWCEPALKKPITVNTFNNLNTSDKNLLFPNPSHAYINVRLNRWSDTEIGNIEVYDLTGRKLYFARGNKNSNQNAMKNLAPGLKPGMYILRTTSGKGEVWSQKFVKH